MTTWTTNVDKLRIQIMKIFLKRLYNIAAKTRKPYHRVNLRGETRKDILWWKSMFPVIPERDILKDRQYIFSYDMYLNTDTSKTHGAAIYGKI